MKRLASPFIIGPDAVVGFLDSGGTDERQAFYRRTDHPDFAGSGERTGGGRCMPQAQLLGAVVLPLEGEVWRHDGIGGQAAEGTGTRKHGAQAHGGRAGAGYPHAEGREFKKVVSLAERRRCVTYLKTEYEISERHACQAMDLHRSSYRHVGKRDRFDDAY